MRMVGNKKIDPEFFDGRVLKWVEVPDLKLGEIRYSASQKGPAHVHERACFHFLFEGGYIEHHGRPARECGTHTLAFQPKWHEHSYIASQSVSRAFTIELEDVWLQRMNENSVILDE